MGQLFRLCYTLFLSQPLKTLVVFIVFGHENTLLLLFPPGSIIPGKPRVCSILCQAVWFPLYYLLQESPLGVMLLTYLALSALICFLSLFSHHDPLGQTQQGCVYIIYMLLALKCTLMHTASRASWAWFGSSLFHLCYRASF